MVRRDGECGERGGATDAKLTLTGSVGEGW